MDGGLRVQLHYKIMMLSIHKSMLYTKSDRYNYGTFRLEEYEEQGALGPG